jgi:hypothetical protein
MIVAPSRQRRSRLPSITRCPCTCRMLCLSGHKEGDFPEAERAAQEAVACRSFRSCAEKLTLSFGPFKLLFEIIEARELLYRPALQI